MPVIVFEILFDFQLEFTVSLFECRVSVVASLVWLVVLQGDGIREREPLVRGGRAADAARVRGHAAVRARLLRV